MKKLFVVFYVAVLFPLYAWGNVYCVNDSIQSDRYKLLVRPNFNIGFLESNLFASYGMRALLPAGKNQAFGLEFSTFQSLSSQKQFYTAGIILERKVIDWFNMSIGTIGYFNFDLDRRNYIGLVTNLGWEPITKGRYSPFITWRSDFIFTKKIQLLNSLNIGLNIKFKSNN